MHRGVGCGIQDLVIFMDKVFEFQGLQFEWDEDKNASNQRKHGVKFEEGAEVFFDAAGVFDDASVGGERRDSVIGFSFVGAGFVGSFYRTWRTYANYLRPSCDSPRKRRL